MFGCFPFERCFLPLVLVLLFAVWKRGCQLKPRRVDAYWKPEVVAELGHHCDAAVLAIAKGQKSALYLLRLRETEAILLFAELLFFSRMLHVQT